MTTIKKLALVRNDFEYDDNYYSHDGRIDIEKTKIFDNPEDAEQKRKELSREEIFTYPTDGNLTNVLNGSGIKYDNISSILSKHIKNFDDDDGYRIELDKKQVTDKLWDDLYPLLKDLYYQIIEIDVDSDSQSIKLDWKTEYSNFKYSGIIENNNFLLHSPIEAAIIEADSDDMDEDDYDYYKRYFLKGKEYAKKSEWISESRKYKIENILNEDKKED